MRKDNEHTKKQSKKNYFEYEPLTDEPSFRENYDISPELEAELIDHGYFLKRRVWRQMKRIQKQNSRPLRDSQFVKPSKKSSPFIHHKPIHTI